ncbi:MAG: hypothetical protein Q8J66_07635 [Methylotenera sp.]|nr:hypothetical protein [Methylotenera sp.]
MLDNVVLILMYKKPSYHLATFSPSELPRPELPVAISQAFVLRYPIIADYNVFAAQAVSVVHSIVATVAVAPGNYSHIL